jgi:hypothetical protein
MQSIHSINFRSLLEACRRLIHTSAPKMALYNYRPLETKSTIRLLELRSPTADDQALRISLRHASLDESTTDYEALSYTWGESQNTFDLQCDDGTKLTITENLKAALAALRLPDKSRVLWVDALCINQLDALEKNVQVPLMKDIYEKARLTIVFLGEEADDSRLAMEYAEHLCRKARLELVSAKDLATAIIQEHHAAPEPRPNKELTQALCLLLARPWFVRAWVVQEFAVPQEVMFLCGSSTCHWAAPYFVRMELRAHAINLETFTPRGSRSAAGPENVTVLAMLRASKQLGHRLEFATLITMTAHTLSGLPHDKLYSLLGLSDDARKESSLQPRYDLPAESVYCAYAAWMGSSQEGCLRMLSLAQSADSTLKLPSWVPDWTAGKYREVHEIKFRAKESKLVLRPDLLVFDASGALSDDTALRPFTPYVKNGNTLVARGMIRDVVLSCSPPYRMSTLPNARPNLYRVVRDARTMSRMMYAEMKEALGDARMPAEHDPDIFARRLLLYRTSENKAAPPSWKDKFSGALEVLRPVYLRLQGVEIMNESPEDQLKLQELLGNEEMATIDADIMGETCSQADRMEAFRRYNEDWAFYSSLQCNTAGMALCRTLTGSLALVPDTTRAYDQICIFSGGVVPFALRPLNDAEQSFQLIGEAISPGQMYGAYVREGENPFDTIFSGSLFDLKERDIYIQ